MTLKKADPKTIQLEALRQAQLKATSQAQSRAIQKDIYKLRNGIKSEDQNAYFIDFHTAERADILVLHDIRLEYHGQTAQMDHILFTRDKIIVLESKSVDGTLKINKDGSITATYKNKETYTMANPVEQNKRHIKVLRAFLEHNFTMPFWVKKMGGLNIESMVLIDVCTTVSNHTLPLGYARGDKYISELVEDLDKKASFFQKIKTLSMDKVWEMAQRVKTCHISKVTISKYQNTEPTEAPEVKNIAEAVEICPRCKDGNLVQRTSKKSTKYKNKTFLGCSRYPKCKYSKSI